MGIRELKNKDMASPQKENGFTPVANELFEALAKIRIPGESRQILDVIIRQTYGFNKSEDAISLSQFVLKTGLKKNATCKALNKLKSMNLITQKVNDVANIYRFNKDFSTWKPLPKKGTSTPKGEWGVPQKVKKYTPKGDIQKTITKDIITKDIAAEPPEVNQLLDFFKKTVNEHINFGNKTERRACKDLLEKYGLQKTKDAIIYLEEKRKTDKYLPLITTPYELWTKWAKIKQHLTVKKRKIWTTTPSLPSLQGQNIK